MEGCWGGATEMCEGDSEGQTLSCKKIKSQRCNVQHKEYSQQLCNKFVW